MFLEPRPGAQRLRQRAFVQIVQFAADGHPMGEAGDIDLKMGQLVHDVVGRCLPLYGGVDRQNDFRKAFRPATVDQRGEIEILRADAVERRQGTAQDVIRALTAPARSSAQRSATSSTTTRTL